MENGTFDVSGYLSFLMVAFLAFAYHEFAHAIVADRLGDPTPRENGRITLNPFPHLDLIGFVLLATLGFGWATTPVNPRLLRGNQRQSYALVSIAGPVANVLMALFFAIILRAIIWFGIESTPEWVIMFLWIGVWLNCFLATFNMLPVPPLDGFSILTGLLPAPLAYQLMPLRRYGMLIFLLIFFILPQMGFSPFEGIFSQSLNLAALLAGIPSG